MITNISVHIHALLSDHANVICEIPDFCTMTFLINVQTPSFVWCYFTIEPVIMADTGQSRQKSSDQVP